MPGTVVLSQPLSLGQRLESTDSCNPVLGSHYGPVVNGTRFGEDALDDTRVHPTVQFKSLPQVGTELISILQDNYGTGPLLRQLKNAFNY